MVLAPFCNIGFVNCHLDIRWQCSRPYNAAPLAWFDGCPYLIELASSSRAVILSCLIRKLQELLWAIISCTGCLVKKKFEAEYEQ